jgi:iron complex outermembrane receptor protein
LLSSLALCLAAGHATAEQGLEAPAVRVVEPDAAEPEVDDPTVSAEVVEGEGLTAGSTLADVLDSVPGVRVRRLGGLEAYATVSIRGSTALQVLVLRDGVPLGSASTAEVNLAEISLADIERIEIYRSPGAGQLGAGGLGGVVNLVSRGPRPGRAARLDLGLGSFLPGSLDLGRVFAFTAERRVSGQADATVGPVRLHASSTLLQTEGDFTYLDDNGTIWEQGDDLFARRANNDATQGDLALRAVASLSPSLRLTASEVASARDQGIAGHGTALAGSARLRTASSLTAVELARDAPQSVVPRLRGLVSARLRRDEWLDPQGEIGVGREHQDDLTVDVGGEVRAGWPLRTAPGSAWLASELRHEELRARRLLGEQEGWGWRRTTFGVGGWLRFSLASGILEIAPQGRIELSADAPEAGGPRVAGGEQPRPRTAVVPSGQFGAIVRPVEWAAMRGSIGFTERQPTFLELFGNRGIVVGNPLLRPESGWTLDAGLRLAGRAFGPVARSVFEVTGFARLVDDLIQIVPNSQVTFVATNVGGATIAGAEATFELAIDWASAARTAWPGLVTLRAGLTFMDAVDRSDRAFLEGRQLPLRPRWEVFGRLAASYGPFEIAYELDFLSGNFLDPYNSFPVPHRLFHGAEATADLRRWRGPSISIVARNLGDRITEEVPVRGLGQRTRPVADVAGFPLPGVTLLINLRWDLPPGPA